MLARSTPSTRQWPGPSHSPFLCLSRGSWKGKGVSHRHLGLYLLLQLLLNSWAVSASSLWSFNAAADTGLQPRMDKVDTFQTSKPRAAVLSSTVTWSVLPSASWSRILTSFSGKNTSIHVATSLLERRPGTEKFGRRKEPHARWWRMWPDGKADPQVMLWGGAEEDIQQRETSIQREDFLWAVL